MASLRRDLPNLRTDGTIKFRAVLARARSVRAIRRECEARGYIASPRRRLDRVRADMAMVRAGIANDRAFWSVDNVPTIALKAVRREWFGHAWTDFVPVEPAAAELARAA